MTEYTLINDRKETEKTFDSRSEAQSKKEDMIALGMDSSNLEIVTDGSNKATEEVADGGKEPVEPQPTEPVETEVINTPEQLAQDPIARLESHNTDFVNTIKGTPAISKQGFRFIQAQFGITTESEVVETFIDPVGVIVWARAELPDGQSAEAHGEGYLTERDVDDNEFARYADTRAKNRAISDLTSAGALAVSEISRE